MSVYLSVCFIFPPQSVRVLSVTPLTRTRRATTTSPWTATSRDTTTCHPSADPPPPGALLSDNPSNRASFPSLHFGDDFRPALAKKETILRPFLTIWAQTTQRAAARCLSHPGTAVYCGCLLNSTLPLCGLMWYLLHRDRLVIQTEEPAGCGEEVWTGATSAGLQLHSLPLGKMYHKTQQLKAATHECLCVWTHLNML